ncbi:MAG TPA: hypothetical protein VGG02_10295 [Chthoniobacterales bacterium]|jgi:hypothetical protein
MFREGRLQNSLGQIAAAFALVALLMALLLSAAPQLHERFHADAGAPTHHCAVTLISSGHCAQTALGPIAIGPARLISLAVLCLTNARVIISRSHSSLLEHAPPLFA